MNVESRLQSPHKSSLNKGSFGIKLIFQALHQAEIRARLAPDIDLSFQIDRTALDHQASPGLPGLTAQFGNGLYQAGCCIPWAELYIQDTIACMGDHR